MTITYTIRFGPDGVTVSQTIGNGQPGDDRGGTGIPPHDTGGTGVPPHDTGGSSGPQADTGIPPHDTGGTGIPPHDTGSGDAVNIGPAIVFGPIIVGLPEQTRAIGPKRERERIPKTRPTRSLKHTLDIVKAPMAHDRPHVLKDFRMDAQQQDNWCWATVAAALYNQLNPGVNPKTQCEVASELLATDCCADPSGCNMPKSMHDALESAGVPNEMTRSCADYAYLANEIDQGHPVVARILWDPDGDLNADGAHFVVICGCKRRGETEYITVCDPAIDDRSGGASVGEVSLQQFRDHYRGSGHWVASYYVRG